MKFNLKILNAVKYTGGSVLLIGIIISSLGFFVSGSSTLTSIGIGTVVGAVFIFLMGVFFVATEEMIEKSYRGIKTAPIKTKKRAPL
jgi:multisubunit Na+/H+ antiporter MnhE subunit